MAFVAGGSVWAQTYDVSFSGFGNISNTTVNVASLPQEFTDVNDEFLNPQNVLMGIVEQFTLSSVTSGGDGKVSVSHTSDVLSITVSGTFSDTATIYVEGSFFNSELEEDETVGTDIYVTCVEHVRTQPQRFATTVNLADLIEGDTLVQGFSVLFNTSAGMNQEKLTLSAGRYYINVMNVAGEEDNHINYGQGATFSDSCGIALGGVRLYPYTGTELGDAWVVTSVTDEDMFGGATLHIVRIAGIQMPPVVWTSGTCTLSLIESSGVLTVTPTTPGVDGITADYNDIGRPWYNDRAKIKSLVVADGVTRLGKMTFYFCQDIASISLGNDLTHIGEACFQYCSSPSLTSVVFPASLRVIGKSAFSGTCFTSLSFHSGIDTIGRSAFANCSNLTSINFGDTVGVIDYGAFASCNNLTSVDINYAKVIGYQAFNNSTKIASVNINATRSIGQSAFMPLLNVEAIHIGKVDTIYDQAFYVCQKDTVLTIDSVGIIRNGNFTNLQKLTSLEIGHVDSIGNNCFTMCQKLKTLTLPEGLKGIGMNAFQAALQLETIHLPSTLKNIGQNAFASCSAVSDIYLPADPANLTWGNTNNSFKSGKATICHVPSQWLSAYEENFSGANVTFAGDYPTPKTARMAEGTEDIEHWTITPAEVLTEGLMPGSTITATYTGTRKVKSVKAVKAVPPTITIDGLVLNGQDGDTWETIAANNPGKIEAYAGFVSRLPDGANLMDGECGDDGTNAVSSTSTYNASWANGYHFCGD